jgi:hypothetical protein
VSIAFKTLRGDALGSMLLMGIEIRLFLGIDAFSAFSGMPFA